MWTPWKASQFICFANQATGFSMVELLVPSNLSNHEDQEHLIILRYQLIAVSSTQFGKYFENQKKCPDFGKKCPGCVYP